MNKTNNLRAYLRDLYEGIVSKKPDASRNPQNFRSEIEAIRTGGELYEVMDASELPEDAPNGSLALVEGEPIPEAYTVSSVDELPSNAVDGSMAIVEIFGIGYSGRWKLADNPSVDGLTAEELYPLSFFSNGNPQMNRYIGYVTSLYGASGIFLKYYGEEYGSNNAYVSTPAGPHTTAGWQEQYQFIDIQQESVEEPIANWLNNNGKKIGILYLYTRENGQWVYKCEVV